MIIWRGWGILAVLVPGLALISMQLGANAVFGAGTYEQASDWLAPIALLFGAAVVWPLGRWFNNKPGRTLLDPATGQPVVLRRQHSLFFIKMEYWAVALAAGAVFMLVANLA